MKTLKLIKLVLILVVVFFNTNLFSQVLFKAEVKNQTSVPADPTYGNCVYFDIYLAESTGSMGPLYLANADFKFFFNVANFTTPLIEYIAGSAQLYNKTGGSASTWYEAGISPAFVTSNELSISINPPSFNLQTQFNERAAMIDGTPNHNKLGTFVVYTCNMTGTFGLEWKTGVGGTVVTSYAPTTPWNSYQATGTLLIPPDNPMPIELTSFIGNVANKRDITLNWNTANETNNKGFDIERKLSTTETWVKVGYIDGKGTTTTPTSYRFEDRKLNTGKYNYRLKQMDFNGNFEYFDLNELIEVGVPTKYDLSQNYPNPFNPTTKVDFDLPFASRVTMKLYDMSGREVITLVNDERTAGYYTEIFNMSNLSSGAYFYRISANGNGQNFVMSKKLMLIK